MSNDSISVSVVNRLPGDKPPPFSSFCAGLIGENSSVAAPLYRDRARGGAGGALAPHFFGC